MPKSMVHISYGTPPVVGGIATFIEAAAVPLIASGHRVSIVGGTLPARDVASKETLPSGVDVHRVPEMCLDRPGEWTASPLTAGTPGYFTAALSDVLGELEPDVVFAHLLGPGVCEAVLRSTTDATARYYVPHVVRANDTALRESMHLPGWTGLIAVSEWQRDRIRDDDPPPVPIFVINPSVDATRFIDPGRHMVIDELTRPGEIALLAPSRLHPTKGALEIALALGSLHEARTIGRLFTTSPSGLSSPAIAGGYRDAIVRSATRIGVDERVHFLDLAAHTTVGDTMARALVSSDVAVFCFRPQGELIGETFAMGPLEAMAAGVPVAAVVSGGMSTYFRDDFNGIAIVVGPDGSVSSRDIARAVIRAHEQRDRLVPNGIETARGFGPQVFLQRLLMLPGLDDR